MIFYILSSLSFKGLVARAVSKSNMVDDVLGVVEFFSGIGGMHFALKGKQFVEHLIF